MSDGKAVTVGGRVLGVTALGANLDAAVQRAYEAVEEDLVRRHALPQGHRPEGARAPARLQAGLRPLRLAAGVARQPRRQHLEAQHVGRSAGLDPRARLERHAVEVLDAGQQHHLDDRPGRSRSPGSIRSVRSPPS